MIDNKIPNNYSKEEKILISNIIDKYNSYLKYGKSTCSNFLNIHEFKLITNYLDHLKIEYHVYDKYDFLEKRIIYFGEYEDFITFYQIKNNKITHQQVLGTLFSLGLTENMIGDIIVEDDYIYYSNLTRLNVFLEENLRIVANKLIRLEKINKITLIQNHFSEFSIIVSSMRLDNVLSKITSKSRSQVLDFIKDKQVLLNYQEIKNSNINLKEDDILSIHKIGKFKISKSIGISKKNNIILEIKKYI